MKVNWKDSGHPEKLRTLIAEQTSAKQRDRYRVVLIAGEGLGERPELRREEIAAVAGRSRQFVDLWVGRYRSGGLEALVAKRQKGNKPALTLDQQKQLCELLDRGPTAQEGLAAYNGPIIKQKIEELFGKALTLGSVYRILHRLGYNDLMPRTTHPDTSPEVMEAFKKKVLPERLAQLQAEHPGKKILSYYQDEARFGQHGTITRVWAKVGTRPPAIQQNQYDYLYVFSAVCPANGQATGLITPQINTDTMNAFLEQFSTELPEDVHAAMILDQAGWHVAKALKVPANVTLIHLPPKSPQLNPAENLWHYLRSHYWSNRFYKTWEDLKTAATDAWRKVCLVPDLIASICADTALRAD